MLNLVMFISFYKHIESNKVTNEQTNKQTNMIYINSYYFLRIDNDH